MSTISRRAFLKTVGIGALSVAAMSVLAGCDTVNQQPVVDNSVGTVNGSTSQTYLVGDYSVMADFRHPLFYGVTTNSHMVLNGALDSTLNGYVSNYDQTLMQSIAWVIDSSTAYKKAGYILSASDISDILSAARSRIQDNWANDFILFSTDITNYTLEDLETDAMWANRPADLTATTLTNYTQNVHNAANGISPSSIVTASTGSCAIWGNNDATPNAFADTKNTVIKAALDAKTGVRARFTALALLPRDWTSVNIKIAVPGATKEVVYPVTRATVNWNEIVVSIQNNVIAGNITAA